MDVNANNEVTKLLGRGAWCLESTGLQVGSGLLDRPKAVKALQRPTSI